MPKKFTDKPDYSFTVGSPPETSRYFKNKGLRPSFHWQDFEPEEHAIAFTVAKSMNLDVLNTIKDAMQEAIDKGIPYRKFAKGLEPRLQELGWWGHKNMRDPLTGELVEARLGSPRRLRIIYDANLRSARAAGQWARINRTKKALPYLQYNLGVAENHRPHHEAKAGLIRPVDDPFWDSWYPPSGWGCKCWVRQITRGEAESFGISPAPKITMKTIVNKRTGVIKEIPAGIDPGWDRNTGKMRQDYMQKYLNEKLDASDPMIARVAARDMATSWRIARIHEGSAPGAAPVAMLPERLANLLGSKTRVVQYSDYTAAKARKIHSEIDIDRMADLDRILHEGEVYQLKGDSSIVVVKKIDGDLWAAAIKATAKKDELFLSTFFRANSRYTKRHFTKDNLIKK